MEKSKINDIIKMNMPGIEINKEDFLEYEGDLVLPVFKSDFDSENGDLKASELIKLNEKSKGLLNKLIKLNKFSGKDEETLIIPMENSELILIGCGNDPTFDKDEYIDEENPGYEKVRMLGIKTIETANKIEKKNISIAMRGFEKCPDSEILYRVLADGFVRAFYHFDYKKKEEKAKDKPVNYVKDIKIIISDDREKDKAEKGTKAGLIIGRSVNFARSLVDETSNRLYPATLVEFAREFLKDSPCDIEVWDYDRIKKEGLGCLEAVGKGNEGQKTESRFMIIRGKKKSKKGKLGLVGKGVTFDTGGYNLKPKNKMHALMKKDMGGSAAIIAITKAILELDLDIELVTAIPTTENTISETAIKPGDVVKAYNGKSVEILNTDAEGRLIMADALAYLSKNEKPDYLIDAATLTGSTYIALGLKIGGFLGNNPERNESFKLAAQDSGESFWQFPLPKTYREQIDGTISDITNIGANFKPYGGTMTAALFLNEFIGECKNWIHIDMSAPTYAIAKTYLGDGALGFSVATVTRYVELLSK